MPFSGGAVINDFDEDFDYYRFRRQGPAPKVSDSYWHVNRHRAYAYAATKPLKDVQKWFFMIPDSAMHRVTSDRIYGAIDIETGRTYQGLKHFNFHTL